MVQIPNAIVSLEEAERRYIAVFDRLPVRPDAMVELWNGDEFEVADIWAPLVTLLLSPVAACDPKPLFGLRPRNESRVASGRHALCSDCAHLSFVSSCHLLHEGARHAPQLHQLPQAIQSTRLGS